MKKNLFVFILIALLLVACDTAGDEAAEEILPTVVPTIVIAESNEDNDPADDSPAEENALVEEEGMGAGDEETAESTENVTSENETMENSFVNLDDLIVYDEPQNMDYRSTLEFRMVVDDEVVGAANAEGSRTVSPSATNVVFSMTGDATGGLGEMMTITQIEDAFYALLPQQECITLVGQNGFDNPFDLFLDAGGFLTEDAERVLPDETINGVESYHYVLNEENLLDWEVYEIYESDLYIAKEGGYVTRLRISGRGVNNVLNSDVTEEGDIFYELNFIPESVPPISPPQGCTDATEINTEFPVLDDATAVQSVPGLFSYETQASFEDVIAFYKETLTENNEWAIVQEIVQEPNASITFSGAGGTLMVNLGPGPSGGVIVGILSTP